ncbi:unnamed protein product [Adineta steineri]|uniref:Cellulase n=1 Tax=Adineta steineri TaxID=433720 RepID=A0A814K4M7_9BILA|nr:unnamed protein product [Adineta steineri]CAF3861288.1 unnamed protein product [Adineta steineri]
MINFTSSSSTILALLVIYILSVKSIVAQINWNGNNWAMSCDFQGNELSNVQIPGEQCGGRCSQTSGCTHFTWNQYKGGTCWMKTGSVTTANAFKTDDPSMVCGVMNIVVQQGGQPGTTTRYWDCCKPSCAWPDKVSGASGPVRSCSRDGYDILGNSHATSGCDGGEAFVCNNQQPRFVSEQLAYGFAAANIPGLNDNVCCACYKLDFTSGSAQGKSMIVQVTNTGPDLKAHQFDLQIPGSGVGIRNACSNQWNTGTDGWGQRYGGVSSAQQCDALPEPLRNGCLFRFNWFRGADNPNMVYSKVQCPKELIDASGCKRNGD